MAKAHIFVQLEEEQKNDFDVNLLKSRQEGHDTNKSKLIRDVIDKFNSNPTKFLKFLKSK
jgi:hypothetical protein